MLLRWRLLLVFRVVGVVPPSLSSSLARVEVVVTMRVMVRVRVLLVIVMV